MMGFVNSSTCPGGEIATIVTLGIDLAKNIFAPHGVDADGRVELQRPAVRRDTLEALVAELPPCLIGMEACSGGHDWARRFARYGHTVKLIAPKFVAPYRLSGKRGDSRVRRRRKYRRDYKSLGVMPVCLAKRASILGPISSPS